MPCLEEEIHLDWIVLVYVSALIIAISFSVLVYYIIRTLKATEETLTSVSTTIKDVENQLGGVSTELTALLNKTNKAADQIQQQTASLSKVTNSLSEVGTEVIHVQNEVKNFLQNVSKNINRHNDGISQAIKFGSSTLSLLKKWRDKKS
jgi:uncharacterized protein YoxC